MKKNKSKIIVGAVIIAVLAFVFWYGGNAPGMRGWTPQPKESTEASQNDVSVTTDLTASTAKPVAKATEKEQAETEQKVSENSIKKADEPSTEENNPQSTDGNALTPDEKVALAERIAEENSSSQVERGNKEYSVQNGMIINESTGKDKYLTDPVPEGKPLPIEPENAVITDKELTCTLSVRCDTILENIAWLDKEKVDIVPKDGVIFAEKTVTFYEGESVFNLLIREMKKNKIHMEFENTPIYNSAYIEGIANLYEFDCGELSGWMYKVNGWFPNYGCSRYQLKNGDKVEWVYTCDLGVDVGGYYAASGN